MPMKMMGGDIAVIIGDMQSMKDTLVFGLWGGPEWTKTWRGKKDLIWLKRLGDASIKLPGMQFKVGLHMEHANLGGELGYHSLRVAACNYWFSEPYSGLPLVCPDWKKTLRDTRWIVQYGTYNVLLRPTSVSVQKSFLKFVTLIA